MTIETFRSILKEEIREAIQSELRSILTEAVEIASRPENNQVAQPGQRSAKLQFEQPDWVKELNEHQASQAPLVQNRTADNAPFLNMLDMTKKEMSSVDYANFK